MFDADKAIEDLEDKHTHTTTCYVTYSRLREILEAGKDDSKVKELERRIESLMENDAHREMDLFSLKKRVTQLEKGDPYHTPLNHPPTSLGGGEREASFTSRGWDILKKVVTPEKAECEHISGGLGACPKCMTPYSDSKPHQGQDPCEVASPSSKQTLEDKLSSYFNRMEDKGFEMPTSFISDMKYILSTATGKGEA